MTVLSNKTFQGDANLQIHQEWFSDYNGMFYDFRIVN
jgi:hypothetical protein